MALFNSLGQPLATLRRVQVFAALSGVIAGGLASASTLYSPAAAAQASGSLATTTLASASALHSPAATPQSSSSLAAAHLSSSSALYSPAATDASNPTIAAGALATTSTLYAPAVAAQASGSLATGPLASSSTFYAPAASDAGGESLIFGNSTITGTPTGTNAPLFRKINFIGDSRVSGSYSGGFEMEVLQSCGEWCWVDFTDATYNFAVGGDSINEQVLAATSAAATGAKVFVVLVGVNGAHPTNPDNLANRQSELLSLLGELDGSGNVVFLCNEMPYSTTSALHLSYHNWIDGLTSGAAGLASADLVIVDTWAAVNSGSATLDARWVNDGLHPADRGQERMARAVWSAMNDYFTGPCIDSSAPSQQLLDGTTTASVNRGTVPFGWNDFSAADGIVYSTSGVGSSTVLSIENTGGITAVCNLRRTPSVATDGVLFVEYELEANTSASDTSGAAERDWEPKINITNTDIATSFNFAPRDVSTTGQDQEFGGVRRVLARFGATHTSPLITLLFRIRPGQKVYVHRVEVYER